MKGNYVFMLCCILFFVFQEPSLDQPDENEIPKIKAEEIMKPLKEFPLLSETKINSYISKNENSAQQAKAFKAPIKEPAQVPMSSYDKPTSHYINQRRLEVIKDCIQYIYDNKISEARKVRKLTSTLFFIIINDCKFLLCCLQISLH